MRELLFNVVPGVKAFRFVDKNSFPVNLSNMIENHELLLL
jgi:hypothetical protein